MDAAAAFRTALLEDGRVIAEKLRGDRVLLDSVVFRIEQLLEHLQILSEVDLAELVSRFATFDPDIYWIDGLRIADLNDEVGPDFASKFDGGFVIVAQEDAIEAGIFAGKPMDLRIFAPRSATRFLISMDRAFATQRKLELLYTLRKDPLALRREIERLTFRCSVARSVLTEALHSDSALTDAQLIELSFDLELQRFSYLVASSANLGRSIEDLELPMIVDPLSPDETGLADELNGALQVMQLWTKRYSQSLDRCFDP